jgi:proteasome assembly chaperone (PAC2) family protein
VHWPANQFWSGKIAGSDRDVILLLGVEPGLKWRTFSEQVVGVAHRLGVSMTVTLGALLAEVAHTRPASVFATTQHPSLTARFGIEGSRYQGPTGIVGALSSALNAADVPTVSMWAAVPTYVPSAQSPKAILALVQALGALLQAPMVTTDLEIAAAAYDRQINELVSEDDDTLEYVTALEARHDHDEDDPPFDLGHGLAEEIEQFLREQE